MKKNTLFDNLTKICKNCGLSFSNYPRQKPSVWKKRKFCSQHCAAVNMGKTTMNEEKMRKIGKANLGRKYPNRKLTTEHRANIALARKKEWGNGKRHGGWKLTKVQRKNMSLARKGKHLSIEHRRKLSVIRLNSLKTHRGANHHNWKGGITTEICRIRKSVEYKLWREAVFGRDNYTCVWCGAKCGNGKKVILNADHIKPFSLFPELRFCIDNGRTLCRQCHLTTHTYGGRIK